MLPDAFRSLVELIRKHQGRQQLSSLLLAGGNSVPAPSAHAGYFAELRNRIKGRARE
jgi:hypothetical protein